MSPLGGFIPFDLFGYYNPDIPSGLRRKSLRDVRINAQQSDMLQTPKG